MSKKKKQEQLIHGLLLINKPQNVTSHDVVARVRRCLHTRAVGHAGTLDPLATGLLVILVGNATKLSDFLLKSQKSYFLKAQLGLRTDTLDITGETISEKSVDCTENQVREAIECFRGDFTLPVPMYSAIKKDGKKLYDLARTNRELEEIPTRPMSFFDFTNIDINPNGFSLGLSCSKGSYIRTFIDQVGLKLGCGATMTELVRTESEPYKLVDAIDLRDLEEALKDCQDHLGVRELLQQNTGASAFIPLGRCLPDWKSLKIDGLDEKLLLNGQLSNPVRNLLAHFYYRDGESNSVKVLSRRDGHLLALLEEKAYKSFKIRKVFPRQ